MIAAADTQSEQLGAYRTLEVDVRASAAAIRARYLELAQLHHPDRFPQGSAAQREAGERMRGINVAFGLIRSAPLQDQCFDVPAGPEPTLSAPSTLDRPISVLTETIALFVLGGALGLAVAAALARRGVPGRSVYVWLLPLILALVAGVGSRCALDDTVRYIFYWT